MLTIEISLQGLSVFLLTLAFSIKPTTSIPFKTIPKIVCLPSNHGVGTVVMKNCDLQALSVHASDSAHVIAYLARILESYPLVFGPAFAMLRMPGLSCFRLAWNSSSNSPPQMLSPPVPSPSGSPEDDRGTVMFTIPTIWYLSAQTGTVKHGWIQGCTSL